MRVAVVVFASFASLAGIAGCKSSAEEGAEAARKEVEAEVKRKAAAPTTAKKVAPPVAGRARIPCEQLIDAAGFTAALGEKDPLTIKDVSTSQAEAAASCSLVRGGTRPTQAQQEAMLKKSRRLGVMAGDDICNVTAFCWTVEDDAHFKQRCKDQGFQDDDSLGFYACVQVVAQGADDVRTFRVLDDDTKCVLQVRGGPSMTDNAVISTCAKAAHDLIGTSNIAVGAAAPAPAAGETAGSAQ
jgi:hypothetical protein